MEYVWSLYDIHSNWYRTGSLYAISNESYLRFFIAARCKNIYGPSGFNLGTFYSDFYDIISSDAIQKQLKEIGETLAFLKHPVPPSGRHEAAKLFPLAKSVISMILQESIFITIISGYFGLFSGMLVLRNIGSALEEDYFIKDPSIDLSTAIISTIILIIFGAVAGYIPAKRAASIKPIVALRDE